jgi:hypothetical protein
VTARAYPMPRPEGEDPRFTFGLTFDVAAVLEKAGYPKPSGVDLVGLMTALHRFLYGVDEAPAEVVSAAKAVYAESGARLLDEDQPLAARGHGQDDAYQVRDQRAELHIDLPDARLVDLAVRSVYSAVTL